MRSPKYRNHEDYNYENDYRRYSDSIERERERNRNYDRYKPRDIYDSRYDREYSYNRRKYSSYSRSVSIS